MYEFLQTVSTSTEINKPLVDYSFPDSDSAKSNLSTEPSKSDAAIGQPIIYSSVSGTYINETLIPCQKLQTQLNLNLYCSSEDENIDPLSR